MDSKEIEECGKACFVASCKGYIASFDMDVAKTRMVMVAPDGHRVVGDFCETRQEAVASCAKEFIKSGLNHETDTKKA